ncbi:MAG: hypothetical protein K9K81_02400 [Desulfobacteraceae bacterium]|nr:hypothetical protein [Desulfobacteraceae bacterium]
MWRFTGIQDIKISEIEPELRRFEWAVAEVLQDLENVAGQVAEKIDKNLTNIFHAHMAMVKEAVRQCD